MMLKLVLKVLIVLAFLQSCNQSSPQEKQQPIVTEDASVESKNTSLFHNQKDKLYHLELKNERKKDPKLDALLKTVEKAIKRKDVNLLWTVMDEDITSSYGGGVMGYDGFVEVWGPDYQKLWNKLDKILAMGGSFTGDSSYRIPYEGNLAFEAQKIDDMMMPHGCGLTTNENARIYPNEKCRSQEGIQIGRTFAIVDLIIQYYQLENQAIKVNLLGTGIHGFVKNEDFHISSDYSLIIEKNKRGNWRINAFAPWD